MTSLAPAPISTLMHVLIRMTYTALFRSIEFISDFGLVTGLAHDTPMRALQFEMRLGAVIELPGFPIFGKMTTFATRTQPLLVHIVLAVTRRAT